MDTGVTSTHRRTSVGLADQVVYSAGNFALTIAVAHSSSAAQLGAYSLAYASYLLFISVLRGTAGEVLLIRFSGESAGDRRRGAGLALASIIISSGLVAVVGLATGFAVDGHVGDVLTTLSLGFPVLAIQDCFRYVAFASGRPLDALANDCTVFCVELIGIGFAITHDVHSPSVYVTIWALASMAGLCVGALRTGVHPAFRGLRAWGREQGSFAARLATDDLISQISQQGYTFVVAAILGLSGAGALRAAQTAFTIPGVLASGVQASVTPDLVRTADRSLRVFQHNIRRLATVLAVVTLGWSILLLLLPASFGGAVFGESWEAARTLIPFQGIAQAASGISLALLVGMRALSAIGRTLAARVGVLIIGFSAQATGAATFGLHGLGVAIALAAPLQCAVWLLQFRFAIRARRADVAQREQFQTGPAPLRSAAADEEPDRK